MNNILIKSVLATEAFSDSGFPAVEVTVTTQNGESGMAYNIENPSNSSYRPKYLYDNDSRFKGFGVTKAAEIINKYIAPRLIGLPVNDQAIVDSTIKEVLLKNDIPLYINVTSPVSVAVFKAGANSKNMPLYRYLGGQRAFTLPVGGHLCASGSKRYSKNERAKGKPIYLMMAYDFDSFSQAQYALWETVGIYEKLLAKKYGILIHRGFSMAITKGKMDNDEVLWKIMVESIEKAGYTGKIGIHVDIGANDYYNKETNKYEGLFSPDAKSREDMFKLYNKMTTEYPFVVLQDPLEENDLEGFKYLRENNKAYIVGEELFCADVDMIKQCISYGCVDCVLLIVNRFETISDAIKIVNFAKTYGVGSMPKDACGESLDMHSYAVGLNAGTIYERGLDFSSNELLIIESEIGDRVKYSAQGGIKKNI